MTNPKATSPQDLTLISTSTCPSLTNTSKISYKISTDCSPKTHSSVDLSSAIYFQIIKNSNVGKFSEEWIAYKDAKSAFPIGSFSSAPLRKLYRNKSLNTPGFLLAALLNEGIVERESGKVMLFRFKGDEKFLAEMEKLAKASESTVSAVANSGESENYENLKSRKARNSGTAKTATTKSGTP